VLRAIAGGAIVLGAAHAASAQPAPAGSSAVAFVDVGMIAMDREHVEPGQTVIVQDGRIGAVGKTGELRVPEGATVVTGTGHYLMPGLIDAHVHLESWQGVRPDFGDAPLYLAHGVTSVVNLRGTPVFFDWKRRVEAGELLGPTIYTAGEFVIGPRGPALRRDSGELVVGPNVTTAEDVKCEIARQAREGVDVIKYYGGLPLPAYLAMNEAAREASIPVVGHGPHELGIDALLQGRQALAHQHMLVPLYFFPMFRNVGLLVANAAALLVLMVVAVTSRRSPALPGARALVAWLLAAGLGALAVQLAMFFGSALGPTAVLLPFTVLALAVAGITIALAIVAARSWRESRTSVSARVQISLASAAGLMLAVALATFWVPTSWYSTDSGIDRLATRLRDAGISVQTTLAAFEGLASSPDTLQLRRVDPATDYLAADIRAGWRSMPLPDAALVPVEALERMKKVTAALNRTGVLLLAGTDALGAPLIVPGISLHDELRLLVESGLTPYEALRTATVNTAVFLGKDREFGMIAVGKRADLILVDGDPLEDLATLKRPAGVMVRGRWLPRERLNQMLEALRS
jgi:hypothetical protein